MKKSDEEKSKKKQSTNPHNSSDNNVSHGGSSQGDHEDRGDQDGGSNGLNNPHGYTPFALPFMVPLSMTSSSSNSHANRYGIMPTLNTWWPVILAGGAAMSGFFSRGTSSSSVAVEQPTVSTEVSVPEVSRLNDVMFWSPTIEAGVLFSIALRYCLFNSVQSSAMSQFDVDMDVAVAEEYQPTNYYSYLALVPVVITGAFFLEVFICNYAFGRRPNKDAHHDPIYHSLLQGAGRVGPGILAMGHSALSFGGRFLIGNEDRAEVITEVLSDLTVAANIAGRVLVIDDRRYDRYMDRSPDLDGYVIMIDSRGMIVIFHIIYLVEALASAGFFVMDLGVTSVSTNEQNRLYIQAGIFTAADALEGILTDSVATQMYYLTRLAQLKIIADMLTKAGIDPFSMVKGVEPRKIDKFEEAVVDAIDKVKNVAGVAVNDFMDALEDTGDTVQETLHLHTVPIVPAEAIVIAIAVITQAINTFEARLNLSDEDISEDDVREVMTHLKGEAILSLEVTLSHTDGEHVDLNIDAYILALNSVINSILIGGNTNIQALHNAVDAAAVQMRDAVRHGVVHNVVEVVEDAAEDVQDALRFHTVPRIPAEEICQEIAAIHRSIYTFENSFNATEFTPATIAIAAEPLQGVVMRGLETSLRNTDGANVDRNIIAYIAGLTVAIESIEIGADNIQDLKDAIEASGTRMQDAVRHGVIENIGDVMEDVGDVLHLNATPPVPINEINQVIDAVHQAIAEFETALVNQEVEPEAIAIAMAPFQGAVITGLEEALRNTDGDQLDNNITAYIRGIRAIIGEIKVGSLENRQALVKIVKAGGVNLHEAANHGVTDDIVDAFDNVIEAVDEATHHVVHGIRGHTHHLLQDIRHSGFGKFFHLKDRPNEDDLPGSHPDDHGGDHNDG